MTSDLLSFLSSTGTRYVLAEGPQWDPVERAVSWVDIEGHGLIVADLDEQGALVIREHRTIDDRVAFAHPLGAGAYLIGMGRRLAISRPSGLGEASIPLVPPGRRLNDSVIDPAGRLLVGGMSLDGEHAANVLLRVENDGSVTMLDDDLRLSNGLGFSPDGAVLYSVDSLTGVVWARSYDAASGAVGHREIFARFEGVEPDGLSVDEEGCVWVALWGGSCLQRYDATGRSVGEVPVEPQHVTSLAFVGPDLRHAIITTSMLLLDEGQRAAAPAAGRVLTCSSTVRGIPCTPWNRLPLDRIRAPRAS